MLDLPTHDRFDGLPGEPPDLGVVERGGDAVLDALAFLGLGPGGALDRGDDDLERLMERRERSKDPEADFTLEERERLEGASNGGYHYLGAAKILAPIGRAFAEALVGAGASTSR